MDAHTQSYTKLQEGQVTDKATTPPDAPHTHSYGLRQCLYEAQVMIALRADNVQVTAKSASLALVTMTARVRTNQANQANQAKIHLQKMKFKRHNLCNLDAFNGQKSTKLLLQFRGLLSSKMSCGLVHLEG